MKKPKKPDLYGDNPVSVYLKSIEPKKHRHRYDRTSKDGKLKCLFIYESGECHFKIHYCICGKKKPEKKGSK